jgi:hypothetical protein
MEFIRPLPVIAVDRRPGTFGPLVHMIVVGAAGVRLRHREDRLDQVVPLGGGEAGPSPEHRTSDVGHRFMASPSSCAGG